jgi:hypothetical protein
LDEYRFHEGDLPSAYRCNVESFLFNRREYRLLQSKNSWLSFYILNERELLAHAQIHFSIIDGIAKSIVQSPFGGFEFDNNLEVKLIFQFIEFVSSQLQSRSVKKIVIVNPPQLYDVEKHAMLETFLLNQGFFVSTSEVGSVVEISKTSFAEIIHPRKRRKLNQTLQHQFKFRKLPAEALMHVYNFIESHRKKKAYQLSISFEHLQESLATLPDSYVLFGVFNKEELVAASVGVRVSDKIVYHFISDHVRKIGDARPALVLMQGLYDYCAANQIEMLDLGTSATDSFPNFKLIKFKSEIGGKATHKFTFTKQLS